MLVNLNVSWHLFFICKIKLNMKTEIENNNEVELTDELIKEIVKNKKWGCEESLIEMRNMGAKWNIKNNSIVLFTEFF